MPNLTYDSDVTYDTPDYTWDGELIRVLGFQVISLSGSLKNLVPLSGSIKDLASVVGSI